MATTTAPPLAAHIPAAYDGLGHVYDLYWRGLAAKLTPALDQLVFRFLPQGPFAGPERNRTALPERPAVLDLCCGAGHLAAILCRRRYAVTGVDGSADMIRFARRNAPRASFMVADVRRFEAPGRFDAVVSTGDSMNHMLTPHDLAAVFGRIAAALREGGRFVFDMNMAEAFETEWRKSSTVVAGDHLLYVRGKYDRQARLGTTDVTMFRKDGGWIRSDLTLFQRCYSRREVTSLLLDSGFREVSVHPAKSCGIRGRLSVGRVFFVARTAGAGSAESRARSQA